MRIRALFRSFLAIFVLWASSEAKALDITVTNSSGVPNEKVWVMFGPSTPNGQITYYDPVQNKDVVQALGMGKSYQLSRIRALNLSSMSDGKIFFAFSDAGFSGTTGNPDFQYQSGDPDAQMRWDKAEITLFTSTTAGSSAMNLSAVDFYSIPFQIRSFSGTKQVSVSGWHPQTDTATVFKNLSGLLSGTNAVRAAVTATTSAALVYSVPVKNGSKTSKLLRIISPSTVNLNSAQGKIANPYPDPKSYYNSLVSTKNKTTLHGTYGGALAKQPLPPNAFVTQDYIFTATVAKSGDVILTGSGTANENTGKTGQNAVGAQTITIKADQQRVAFYGLAPDYYLASYFSGTKALNNSNSVYDQAISDYFAGMNYGLVNSATPDPRKGLKGKLLGNEPSDAWYSSGPQYGSNPKLAPNQLFGFAQPLSKYYNQYASYLAKIYDAYAFAYSDKSGTPLVDLTPGKITRLEITILPDQAKPRTLFKATAAETRKSIQGNRKVVSYLRVSGRPAGKVAYSEINLNLDIDYPSVDGLSVVLTSPAGEEFVIRDAGDEGEGLHIAETPLPSESSANPNGVWTLTTTDSHREDAGTLVDWSLSFP